MNEKQKNIYHAILHMKANKCLDNESGGWYCGKKSDFQKRHIKAIAYFEKLLEKTKKDSRPLCSAEKDYRFDILDFSCGQSLNVKFTQFGNITYCPFCGGKLL
jgi:phosphomannomutase